MDKVIENTNSMKQPEEWKPIPGYEGIYEVSTWGRVKSYQLDSNGRILSPKRDRYGYNTVNLYKDRRRKTCTIHRLVAEVFLPNPSNFPKVNHKDEHKENNCVSNLEWCTQKYNISYGTGLQRRAEKLSKPVVQFDKTGVFIAEYSSIQEAARLTGIASTPICYCCKHKPGHYSAGGYIFMYKDEYLQNQTQQEK